MRASVLAGIAASLIGAAPAIAAEQQVSIDVSELTCPSCSFTVATAMKRVATVKVIEFQESETFGEGVFTVTYDDAVTTPELIVEAVTANGYPAQIVTAGDS